MSRNYLQSHQFREDVARDMERDDLRRAASHDRCDFFRGARVRCGLCRKEAEFGKFGGAGGDADARLAGWKIQWSAGQPIVRCPAHSGLPV